MAGGEANRHTYRYEWLTCVFAIITTELKQRQAADGQLKDVWEAESANDRFPFVKRKTNRAIWFLQGHDCRRYEILGIVGGKKDFILEA